MGERYYDPKAGRFISPDPVSHPMCMDLYTYGGGDPVNYFDPTGRFFSPIYQPVKSTVIDIWKSPRFHGGLQAFAGLVEASTGGLATLSSGGLVAPVGLPVLAHGLDQFITGINVAITGKHRTTLTEHLLQKTGMPSEWASFTNDVLTIGGTMGGSAIIRASRLGTFPNFRLPTHSAAFETGIDKNTASEVIKLEGKISKWLGEGTRLIRNEAGDVIVLSKDGARCVRFDFNRPTPHNNPMLMWNLKLVVNG